MKPISYNQTNSNHLLKTLDHSVQALGCFCLLVSCKVSREFPKASLKLGLLSHPGPPALNHRPAELQQLLHPALQLFEALLVLTKLLPKSRRVSETLPIVYQWRRHGLSSLRKVRPGSAFSLGFNSTALCQTWFQANQGRKQFYFSCATTCCFVLGGCSL